MSIGGWGGTAGHQQSQRLAASKRPKVGIDDKAVSAHLSNVVEVYDGRVKLGELVDAPGCGVHARTVDGSDLGKFSNRAAASHAVIAAARAR